MNSYENRPNDYSVKHQSVKNQYHFSKLFQQTGGQTSTGGGESVFEIPTRCVNFGRSLLKFTATPAAGTNYNYLQTDILPIQQIQLYTRSGTYLCDVNHLDRYSKIVLKSEVKLDKTVTPNPLVNTTASADRVGEVTGLLAKTSVYHNKKYPVGSTNAANDTWKEVDSQYVPKYTVIGGNTTATPVMHLTIPFSQIKNTILGLDKDFYFGEVLLLKIIWNASSKWGWNATGATDPVVGADTFGAVAISNLNIYLALENDPVICAGLHQSVLSGNFRSVLIPYVWSFFNSGTGSAQVISLRLNGMMGRHVQRIYHALYDETGGENLEMDCAVNGDLIVNYHTAVDNSRRQEYDVTLSSNEDWDIIQQQIPNTITTACRHNYRFNWFILDKFTGDEDMNGDVVDSGLDLSVEHKWDAFINTDGTAFRHYTFALMTRVLSITPEGIQVQGLSAR